MNGHRRPARNTIITAANLPTIHMSAIALKTIHKTQSSPMHRTVIAQLPSTFKTSDARWNRGARKRWLRPFGSRPSIFRVSFCGAYRRPLFLTYPRELIDSWRSSWQVQQRHECYACDHLKQASRRQLVQLAPLKRNCLLCMMHVMRSIHSGRIET